MKISVIIPCRECSGTLGQQLDALARQSWDDGWEVIVSDNGSAGGLESLVAAYRGRIPELRLVDATGRLGPGHARNVGARAASGDALLFCDADDEVGEGWLRAMGSALQRHDFVASRLDLQKLNGGLALQARSNGQRSGVQRYTYPPYLPHAAGCGLGVKRWVHEQVGGFDESMMSLQDTDYCWRIQIAGVPLEFAPDAVVHYRLRHDIRGVMRQALRYGEYNVLLYKKFRAHGMPKLGLKAQVMAWARLLRSLPRLRDPEARPRYLRNLAWRLGRLKGSIKHRVMAL